MRHPARWAALAVGVVVAASARTCAGPNVVRARAIETTVTTETAGDATMARTRARRAMSLFLHFTGSSLACLLSNSGIGWSGKPGPPDVRERATLCGRRLPRRCGT